MGTVEQVSLGFGRSLETTFGEAIDRVKAAFKAEGFGVVSEIDVQKTLEEKIGEQIEPYTILGMCNPNLASQALNVEHEVGLLLPCNVLVHECGGRVHVAAQDPEMLLGLSNNGHLAKIGHEARARIEKAMRLV